MSLLRVHNTNLSGTAADSSLSGHELRELNYNAAVSAVSPVAITGANPIALSYNQWVQSAVGSLSLNAQTGGTISLGPDAASQAAAYVSLFNLNSLNDSRLLRFNLSNASTGPNIFLGNTNGTSTFVQVNQQGMTTAAVGSAVMFSGTGPSQMANGLLGGVAGVERLVQVRPTPNNSSALSPGSQSVQFNILPFSY